MMLTETPVRKHNETGHRLGKAVLDAASKPAHADRRGDYAGDAVADGNFTVDHRPHDRTRWISLPGCRPRLRNTGLVPMKSGRDSFSRVLAGSQQSITAGLAVVVIAGHRSLLGCLSGVLGGRGDAIISG